MNKNIFLHIKCKTTIWKGYVLQLFQNNFLRIKQLIETIVYQTFKITYYFGQTAKSYQNS